MENTDKCLHLTLPKADKSLKMHVQIQTKRGFKSVCVYFFWGGGVCVFFFSQRKSAWVFYLHICVCVSTFKLPPAIISIWGVQDLNETDLPFHYFPLMVIFICLSAQDFIPRWQVFMCVLNLICPLQAWLSAIITPCYCLTIRNWISIHKIKNCSFTEEIKRTTHWAFSNTLILLFNFHDTVDAEVTKVIRFTVCLLFSS